MKQILLLLALIFAVCFSGIIAYINLTENKKQVEPTEPEPIRISEIVIYSDDVKGEYRIMENQGYYKVQKWYWTEWLDDAVFDSLDDAKHWLKKSREYDKLKEKLDKEKWKVVNNKD